MTENDKPLSTMIAQGWEVLNYAVFPGGSDGAPLHSFLLRRQKQHRLLQVRPKMLGKGLVVKELDI